MGSLLGQGTARNERHAAMGRFVLVSLKILRSTERQALRGRESRKILDGRAEAGRCRSLRRRNRARSLASPLFALLAQSPFRSWLLVQTGAVSALGEPGRHSR